MKLVWLFFCVYSVLCTAAANSIYSTGNERNNSLDAGLFIYRNFAPSKQNFVFSPISLRTIYSILYQTSIGKTKNVIKHLLYRRVVALNDSVYSVVQPKYFSHMLQSSSVESANKLYLKTGWNLQKHFRHVVQQYNIKVQKINFDDSNRAAHKINHWIKNATHGLISRTIKPKSITPLTALIAINVLYFKANWKKPFQKSEVRNLEFTDVNHAMHHTNFIVAKGDYRMSTVSDLGITVLEIPYETKTNFVFWIILPTIDHSLDGIRHRLMPDTIDRIRQNFTVAYTKIEFPIFVIHTNLDGKKIAPEMFKHPEYDMLNGTHPLQLSLLQQETKIRVDTKGTEAATATHAHITFRSARRSMRYFIANRPFMFAVMHSGFYDPIFFGHFVQLK